ncbi:protein translocase subunit SecF [Oceanispirochaeta crateris]|uniref:Protein-export membrane protein SecF n=1 Tax=Oceanispirochaeta crateris TaxID=2518645 RepID=A0A5C1QLD4_9SPIO|nr:protein translocase subunit SecF [Oceanispirochaeta crateris]QEN07424.1 protein translocase subunit SecF [Oceanispirochaeta crateris]
MEKVINFTKNRFIFLSISVFLIIAFWAGTFAQGGFNFGIDFRAGLNQQINIEGAESINDVKDALSEIHSLQVQTVGSGESMDYMIKTGVDESNDNFQVEMEQLIMDSLESAFGAGAVTVKSTEFVDARFAGNLASQTILLTIVAMALILIYIWFRFKLNYAVSAIIAIIHDVLFLTGFIGVMQLEFSTATIAAVLTIIGYSLNDTIVIFDRIRENTRMVKEKSFKDVINISISQSLSRTLITSITTFIAVLFIYVIGIGTIKTFALSLIVGIIVGTYSSLYIASTILLGWHDKAAKNVKNKVSATKAVAEKKADPVKVIEKTAAEAVKQSADEIAEATEKKRQSKLKKKKKK